MSKHDDVLNISIQDTPLGMKWTLTISGKTIAGGYAKNLWAALDDTNEALSGFATHVSKVTNGR